jgi:hypothetical protein
VYIHTCLSCPGLEPVAEHLPQGDPEGPHVGRGGELQERDALRGAPGKQGSMLLSQFSAIFPNFRRFFPIFGEKIGIFLKYQCYDELFSKSSFVLSQKRQFFRKNVWRKYLKNHNIGPRAMDVRTRERTTSRMKHLGGRCQGCQMVYFLTKNPNLGKFVGL